MVPITDAVDWPRAVLAAIGERIARPAKWILMQQMVNSIYGNWKVDFQMANDYYPSTRLSIARHEAGHAVAGYLLGASIVSATIIPSNGCDGLVNMDDPPVPSLVGMDRDERMALIDGWRLKQVKIDLAGRAAESLWLSDPENRLSDEFDEVWQQRPKDRGYLPPSWSSPDVKSFWSHSDMTRAIKSSLEILGSVRRQAVKAYVAGAFREVRELLLSGSNRQILDKLAHELELKCEMPGTDVNAFLVEAYVEAYPNTKNKLRRRPPGELPVTSVTRIAQEEAEREWIRRGESALAAMIDEIRRRDAGDVDDEW